jgi:hypothetical protein
MLVACAGEQQDPQPEEQKGTPVQSSADALLKAEELPMSDPKLDTFYLDFAPGDVFEYRITQEGTSESDETSAYIKSTQVYTKRVKERRPDGSYLIGMKITEISMNTDVRVPNQAPRQESFNSKDTTLRTEKRFTQYYALIDREVTLVVDPTGMVKEVRDVDLIVDEVTKHDKNITPEVKMQVAQQLQDGVYRTYSQFETVMYPRQRLDSTRTWTNSTTVPMSPLFASENVATYKVSSVRKANDRSTVIINSTMTGSVKPLPIPPQMKGAMETKVKSSSITGDGLTAMDLQRGFTVRKEQHIVSKLAVSIKDIQSGRSQDSKQTTDMRVLVELLSVKLAR